MKHRAVLFLLVLVLILAGPCFAQEGVDLEKIVVTPSRAEESVGYYNNDTAVLTGSYLEKVNDSGGSGITETFDEINGIDAVSGGKFGSVSEGVYIRGALPRHTAYMLEGIKIYDPSNPSSYYVPSDFSTSGLKRIEVVKTPLSSLYGSSPLAGAINFIVKNPQTKPYVYYEEEVGSFSTVKEMLELGGRVRNLSYFFNAERLDSKGFSRAIEKNGISKTDPYQDTNITLKLNYNPDQDLDIGLVTKAIHSRTENVDDDNYDGVPEEDLENISWNNEFFSTIYLKKTFSQFLAYKIQSGLTSNYRQYRDDNVKEIITDNYMRAHYKGQTYQFLNHFEITPAQFYKALIGFDYTKEFASGYRYDYSYAYAFGFISDFPKKTTYSQGFFIENIVEPLNSLRLNATYRLEEHPIFKGHSVIKTSFNYKVPHITTEIYGSYGEGFKAPSLYQLFDSARGNRNLKPEASKTWEAGLNQPFSDNISLSFCYFHSDFKNLIDFVYTNPTFWVGEFKNADRGKSRGIELEANYKMTEKLNFKSGYTYTKAKQDFVDEDMVTIFRHDTLRIPKHKAFLGINWKDKKIDAFLDLSFVGLRTDRIWMGITDEFVKLKPYCLANLSFNYSLADNKTIFLRIDNILNKDYERIKGYQEEKIAFYSGLKIKL